jgi:hypothetical protein
VEAERWVFGLADQGSPHTKSSDPLPTNDSGAPTLEVQTITLGDDLAIVGLPGEPVNAVRHLVTAAVPHTFIMTVGYANAACGYLPTVEQIPQSGYEVGAMRFAPGTTEALVHAVIAMLVPENHDGSQTRA